MSTTVTIIERVKVDFVFGSVWMRCVYNHDKDGIEQPFVSYNPFTTGTGWRNRYVGDLDTREEVAKYLALHIHVLGRKLSEIPGWEDMPDDAVTITPYIMALATDFNVNV